MGNIIHELQNMTYLNWSQIRNSSGTAGSFLKAYSEIGGRKMYYKISNYDSINGVTGHECVNESPLEFCIRNGWEKYIYEMLVFDFLILNRDRHGANIEVLRDTKRKTIRLAPLFDHGLSLLSLCRDEKMYSEYDVMADRPVQCFVGSHSALENLKLIPKNAFPALTPLKESDKDKIMDGLDEIIPKQLSEKIWEMIWNRWCYYENIRNKK